jgi:hypothetical protein
VAAWAGAAATVLVVVTTSLVALGYFERFRSPRVQVTFEGGEPWCGRAWRRWERARRSGAWGG